MSTVTLLPPPKREAAIAMLESGGTYRWTVAEYEHLVELGVFTPEGRVELLEREIVHKEMPKPEHAAPVDELTEFLTLAGALPTSRASAGPEFRARAGPCLGPSPTGRLPHATPRTGRHSLAR